MIRISAVLLTSLLLSYSLFGQDKKSTETPKLSDSTIIEMPQIMIIGKRDGLISKTPGSAIILGSRDIKQFAPLTSNELLRKVTGINVVDEEGAGLRLNISIRGLDPDRSRNILMLEDGVPIALGPYGEPEMYFTPAIDKMSGIEILKGSGQILFGPQTIGGVVNFFTADPPSSEATRIKLSGAKDGYFSGFASYGNTIGKTGFLVSYLHKRADELGMTNFRLNDLSAKIKIELNEKSNLGIKLGFYDEQSNSTYIGLTQTMFDQGEQDFVRMAPNDNIPIKRLSASTTHQFQINENISLKTTAYAYTTSRNWQRQDFSFNSSASNKTGVIWGNSSITNGAVYMLNSTGNRNRQFEVAGIEPRLSINHNFLNIKNELETGFRYLYEKADEQFVVGSNASTSDGLLRDKEVRTGNSFSAYAQNTFNITKKLSLNAGLRLENFDYERQILRGRYRINNVNNVIRDTNIVSSDNTFALIPGAGFNYAINDEINLFAGVHKGFAPPRIKDAITAEGVPYNLDAELSTNYELGTRIGIGNVLSAEFTAFILDFQNQIIPVSNSSGNLNATGVINGGQTMHKGIEAGFKFDFGKIIGSKSSYTLESSLTLQNSVYSSDRFIAVGGKAVNIKNNTLPYSANVMIWNAVGMNLLNGFGFRLSGNYIGEQFTDELNTSIASANGRTGQLKSRYIIDANAFYRIPKTNASLNLAVKNLSNERYISTRRPEGIRVGLPRLVTAGFEVSF
ncbi:TonB-dependent receptor family protein [Daejeonella sp.]|jgi:Fe(3+) dicitrate transport protein|uniref:TonB-dependent receptor family protein n=1 Tax=Daejeonella sp. TaxID=2805397 RepID=UPI0037BE6EAE